MRGMVKARNDATFFKPPVYRRFRMVGAEEILGLTLFQYQQLLRWAHLAPTKKRKPSSSPDYDKCYYVRPLITLLQKSFFEWFTPGKDNAMDEAGIPSRQRWLRNFNKDKPHKYYIELIMACCSRTRFCWHFFVNESSKKIVKNLKRSVAGRGKRARALFLKVPHYQPEYSSLDREVQDRLGATAAHVMYFSRILRESITDEASDMTYRMYVDRRWDNLAGIVMAKRLYDVSYTATVILHMCLVMYIRVCVYTCTSPAHLLRAPHR